MPGQCCVPRCNTKGGHVFPKELNIRNKWIIAVKRGEKNWQPSQWATVCSNHFDDDDYLQTRREGGALKNRKLKKSSVPHIFQWQSKRLMSVINRQERAQKKKQKEDDDLNTSANAWQDLGAQEPDISMSDGANDLDGCDRTESTTQTENVEKKDCGFQTSLPDSVQFSAVNYQTCDDKFHYYTGMQSYSNFCMILATFGTDIINLQYHYGYPPKMCLEDQFFLTLVKLRTNRCNLELADRFEINEKDVSNIFITWINFLFFHFKDLDWWPSRELVKYFSPQDFREKFPTTRVIIDGTEIPLKKPKHPVAQQASYSTYKNRNTVKALIGVSPGGLVTYVSDIYCGSTSDRQICERSSLLQILESNDSIMADKGFNVQDMFIGKNVELNIPEFFRKKNRMSETSVFKDRKIASKRVHVERIIGLAKTYKILIQPLSLSDASLADAIVSTCFYLCNFRSCIVPVDA